MEPPQVPVTLQHLPMLENGVRHHELLRLQREDVGQHNSCSLESQHPFQPLPCLGFPMSPVSLGVQGRNRRPRLPPPAPPPARAGGPGDTGGPWDMGVCQPLAPGLSPLWVPLLSQGPRGEMGTLRGTEHGGCPCRQPVPVPAAAAVTPGRCHRRSPQRDPSTSVPPHHSPSPPGCSPRTPPITPGATAPVPAPPPGAEQPVPAALTARCAPLRSGRGTPRWPGRPRGGVAQARARPPGHGPARPPVPLPGRRVRDPVPVPSPRSPGWTPPHPPECPPPVPLTRIPPGSPHGIPPGASLGLPHGSASTSPLRTPRIPLGCPSWVPTDDPWIVPPPHSSWVSPSLLGAPMDPHGSPP
ncbi:uncharacterized protein LOC136023829 [Lathamus discolor]|uniref:uncharacterized protein LOC136023829 n=1 Tax=Lathamus discolor TaxID=678569 RepID=UPI0032B7880A